MKSKQKQAATQNNTRCRNIDNTAYEKGDERIDLPTNIVGHEHSAEHYEELNSSSVNNLKDSPDTEHVYSHLNNGPTTAREIDATYSHIPGSEMTKLYYTYSHSSTQDSEQSKHYVEDSANNEKNPTYNHLQDTNGTQIESQYTARSQRDAAYDKSYTEDTYCHLCQENNDAENRKSLHDRDPTYDHLGDLNKSTTDQNQMRPSLDSESSANSTNLHKYVNYTIGAYSYALSDNSCRKCGRETYSYATLPHQLSGNLELEKDKNGYLIL